MKQLFTRRINLIAMLLVVFVINSSAQVTPYSRDSSMISIGGITFDKNDTLYVASNGGGYYMVSPNDSVSPALATGTNSCSVVNIAGSIYSVSNWRLYKDTVGHPWSASGLSNATGIAADSSGNLYIADNGFFGGIIFKLTPPYSGVATILPNRLCYISHPRSITVGSDGNIYVSCDDNTIKKVSPNGQNIITIASGLSSPREMAFDAFGNLFVANSGNNTISVITPNGVVSTFIPSTAAPGLSAPYGLCFDANGNLYISNQNSSNLNKGFISKITILSPTLSNFSVPARTYGTKSFLITKPSSNSRGAFTYSSSNTAIAIIVHTPNNGDSIKMVGLGTCTITAYQAPYYGYQSDSISTTFTVDTLTDVLGRFSIPQQIFGAASLVSITPPTSSSSGIFTYTSSDTTVAKFIHAGKITIVGPGITTITATQAANGVYGSASISTSLLVTTQANLTNFTIPSITYDSVPFIMITPPTSISNGKFTYTSNNTNIAQIVGSVIKIVGVGTVTITATQASTNLYTGTRISTTFIVNPIPTTLGTFTVPTYSFYGTAISIPLTQPTSNNLGGTFTYSSNNTSIATISNNYLNILRSGTVIITATQSANGYYSSGTTNTTLTITDVSVAQNGNYSAVLNSSISNYMITGSQSQTIGNFGTNDFTVMTYFKTGTTGKKQTIISDNPSTFYPNDDKATDYKGRDYLSMWQLSINPTGSLYFEYNPIITNSGSAFIDANYTTWANTNGGGWLVDDNRNGIFSFDRNRVFVNKRNVSTSPNTQTSFCDNLWHHVAVTRSNGGNGQATLSIYVDGTIYGNATVPSNDTLSPSYPTKSVCGYSNLDALYWIPPGETTVFTGTTANLTIGRGVNYDLATSDENNMTYAYFDGAVDETRIFNRALTNCEIIRASGTGSLGTIDTTKQVAYLNYNFSNGSKYFDSSGNHNDFNFQSILNTGGIVYPPNPHSPVVGSIGNAHTVAYPYNLTPDYITNLSVPQNVTSYYTWQDSTPPPPNGGPMASWKTINGNSPQLDITQIGTPLKLNTYFQRVSTFNGCPLVSNTVQIVVAQEGLNNQQNSIRNGDIQGYVYSKDSVKGIAGDTICAYMSINSLVNGRGFSYIDTAITQSDGSYKFNYGSRLPLFYGDNTNSYNPDASSVTFTVYPINVNSGHLYMSLSKIATLSPTANIAQDVNFVDTTTLIVSGKVTQNCSSCITGFNTSAGLDSVNVSAVTAVVGEKQNKEIDSSRTYNDSIRGPGVYGIAINNPGSYIITPNYKNHHFSPASLNVDVSKNKTDINFLDTTTHTISGYVSAGCKNFFGRFTLTFGDVLRDTGLNILSVGNYLQSTVTTDATGYYSVTLPAREWRILKVNSYYTDGNISTYFLDSTTGTHDSTLALYYYNTTLSKDSLTRDIDTANATLNLFYHRQPQIAISGLHNSSEVTKVLGSATNSSCVWRNEYIWSMGDSMPITVKIYEGPVSLNCPVDTGIITILTDFQQLAGNYDTLNLAISHGIVDTFLTAGPPSTTLAPFSKWFNATYTDLLGNQAVYNTLDSLIVVGTSVLPGASVFTTVTPQLPILVLHDPPGDASFSYWNQNTTIQHTQNLHFAGNTTVGEETEVEAGVDMELGLGEEIKVEGGYKFNDKTSITANASNDITLSITNETNSSVHTSSNPNFVGPDYDVVVGAAYNYKYAVGTKVYFLPDGHGCGTFNEHQVVAFNTNGIATTYTYTVNYIRTTLIPAQDSFISHPEGTNQTSAYWANQVNVWQQLLDNINKNTSSVKDSLNLSFSSGTSQDHSYTSSTTQNDSYTFGLEIASEVADNVHLEVDGTGAGETVTVSATVNTSTTIDNSNTTSTTIGYVLDDDNSNANEFISVNVGTDPVYSTPVFHTIAGGTSCPHEINTAAIDSCVLVTDNSDPFIHYHGDSALVNLVLSNQSFSQSNTATYDIFLNSSTNPDGASVSIGGNSPGLTASYPLSYGQSIKVPITIVKNSLSPVFSYPNLQIIASDNCWDSHVDNGNFWQNPHFYSSRNVTVNFPASVSNANLLYPTNNWIVNKNDNNIIPIVFNGYDISKLNSVVIQYQNVNYSSLVTENNYPSLPLLGSYTDAHSLRKNENPGVSNDNTRYNWDVSTLPNGTYNVRLKIQDASGNMTYSNVATNVIIDTTAPALFGRPQPNGGSYVAGMPISFSYTKNIDPSKITVKLLDTIQQRFIPVTTNAFANTVIVAPLSENLLQDSNRVIMVVVSNIFDFNGNKKSNSDTLYFKVSNQSIATAQKNLALITASLGIYNGKSFAGVKPKWATDINKRNTGSYLNKTSIDTVAITFSLDRAATSNQIVNYNLSGNASNGLDYQDLYSDDQKTLKIHKTNESKDVTYQNTVTGIKGISGSIVIKKGDSTATVYIKSLNNPSASTDKQLILTLSPSGNYNIDTAYSATVTIVNNTQNVSGNIISLSGDPIKNVQLQLNGIDSSLVSGSYSLHIPTDSSITIGLYKNNDANPANGITVLDALLVNAHILNKVPLNSPYKLIAADVNEDSMINVSDVLLIKNLILSNSNTFTNTAGKNNLWAFVDSTYQFANPSNPFPYKDSIALNNLSANQPNQTFYGIKLGDVNTDWNASIQGLELPNKPIGLFYNDAKLSDDGLLHIPIKVKDFNSIMGMQFTLNFNSDVLQLNGIKNKALKMEVATKHSDKGALSFLWDDASLVSKSLSDSTELFELVFSTKGNLGNPNIKISSGITQIAAYDGNWAKHYITMTAGKLTLPEPSVATESWDVAPNPSTGIVNLRLSLTQGKEIGFELTSIDGKVLSQQKVDALGGNSTKTLNLTQGNKLASGIYYLKASGIDAKSVKTIIIRQ